MGTKRETVVRRHSRLLYSVAFSLVACAVVASCAIAVVMVYEVNRTESQIESSIKSVLDGSIQQYDSSIIDSDLLEEHADYLNATGLVELWGEGGASQAELEELQSLLSELQNPLGISLLCTASGEQLYANEEYSYLLSDEALADITALGLLAGEGTIYYHVDGTYRVTRVYAVTDTALLLATNLGIVATVDIVADLLAYDDDLEVVYYDELGTVNVYSGDGELAALYAYEDFEDADESTLFDFSFAGQSYFCCYASCYAIDGSEDAVIVVFARDDAAMALRNAALIAGIATLLVVVVCLVAFGSFRNRIYAPVRRMLKQLDFEEDAEDGELQALERGIVRLRQENDAHAQLVREASLLYLLQGRLMLAQESESSGFPFDEGDACVIIGMQIELFEDDDARAEDADRSALGEFVDAALRHLHTRLLAGGFDGVVYLDDGVLGIFIVPVGARAQDDPAAALTTLCQEARDAFAKAGDRSMSLFVSERVSTGQGLKEGYDQVCELAEHCLALERYGTVLRSADLAARPKRDDRIDTALMQRLLDAIQRLDVEQAAACFDEIAAQRDTRSGRAAGHDDHDLVALRSLLRLGLSNCPVANAADCDWMEHLNRELANTSSIDEVRRAMLSTMQAILATAERTSSDTERFTRIEQFVRDNVADANLSGQMVAARFDMSQSNVTRLFKKFTGEGFLPYVHSLRIEQTRAILEQTDKPLEEVAREVGFGNALTMSRAFKKATGMPPGAYREARRRKKE